MNAFGAVISLAIIAEALIEYTTFMLPKTAFPSWLKVYAGMAVGVVLCLIYAVDLMPLVGLERVPIAGSVITGLLIGRGSNVANDLFKRLRIAQVPAAAVNQVLEQGGVPARGVPRSEESPA